MFTFKSVQLEDEALIASYLKKASYDICDLFFPNIYIWMKLYNSKYAIVDDHLVIMENDARFLMPIGDGDLKKVILKLMDYAKRKQIPFMLYAITNSMFQTLETLFPNTFEIEAERESFDYIYKSEDLILLKGKKYQTKRNHINKFKKTYDYRFEEINDHNIQKVKAMHLAWCEENRIVTNDQCIEKEAVQTALEYYKALQLEGGALFVDDTVVAFSFGGAINTTTYNVCIEKALLTYEGSYPMINQCFAQHYCKDYTYINREDDLGLLGLRKAKLSYSPIKLLEKGIVTLKENTHVS